MVRNLAFLHCSLFLIASDEAMTSVSWTTLESWSWRCLMPALLWGGVAASWVIFMILVSRMLAWRLEHKCKGSNWTQGGRLWVAMFALLALGGLWSDDVEAWAFSLEVKSSFWALPLIAAIPGQRIDRDFWWSVGWSLMAYLLWRLVRAGWHQLVLEDARQWRYVRLAGAVHPSYLSLHATVAWLGCGRQWGKGAWLAWTMTVLVSVSLGLLGSKAGILAAVVVSISADLLSRWRGISRPNDLRHLLVFLGLLLAVGWGASKKRFVELETAVAVVKSSTAPVQSSSSGRIAVWRASSELIADYPMGVGTGDVTECLVRMYERDGISFASESRLNSHNQWLQFGVALGWPGLLLLTWMMGHWGRRAWQCSIRWAFPCVLVVVLHATVESILEAQRGVVFVLWMFVAFESAIRQNQSEP